MKPGLVKMTEAYQDMLPPTAFEQQIEFRVAGSF
jgi:hypothetical protein